MSTTVDSSTRRDSPASAPAGASDRRLYAGRTSGSVTLTGPVGSQWQLTDELQRRRFIDEPRAVFRLRGESGSLNRRAPPQLVSAKDGTFYPCSENARAGTTGSSRFATIPDGETSWQRGPRGLVGTPRLAWDARDGCCEAVRARGLLIAKVRSVCQCFARVRDDPRAECGRVARPNGLVGCRVTPSWRATSDGHEFCAARAAAPRRSPWP